MLRSIALYTTLAFAANAAVAGTVDWQAARDAGLPKLIETPAAPVPDIAFTDIDGNPHRLADWRGKVVVLNFWATWCAPCRKEMPQIAELQDEFGGDKFQVLTLATGRNSPAGIKKFFEKNGISNLPRHQDLSSAAAREFGIIALPITVILNPEGQEIARLIGDAEWNSDSAKAIISTLVGAES